MVHSRDAAEKPLALHSLTAQDRAVSVVTHEIPPKDTVRGVAHGIDCGETSDTLASALRSKTHEVLYARLLRKNGLAMVTFRGTNVPRSIVYRGCIIRVTPYVSHAVQCWRCQGLGHKQHVCTRALRCPDCGWLKQEHHVCGRKYCVNCRSHGNHLATDPKCPTKLRVIATHNRYAALGTFSDGEEENEIPKNKPRVTTVYKMLKTGYYADSDIEAQAWMEALRSIGEARKKRISSCRTRPNAAAIAAAAAATNAATDAATNAATVTAIPTDAGSDPCGALCNVHGRPPNSADPGPKP
ncbi:hypothetical protein HPB47_011470 [Ixodes persulcatus]|uniref:Uncharacterized protein n=1 Tax=Ixodes persulcatus TaxID=34615 RepID=A0AC60NWE3_IXOPE|nr:hypothetical protein HPB47_011470 [Ixodes persulcatus]